MGLTRERHLRSALALVLAALPATARQVDGELLTRAQNAAGRPAHAEAFLEGRGRARVSGAEGALLVVLAPGGAFRIEVDGALPSAAGFDGQRAWTRDPTGLARIVELEEADQLQMLFGVLSGHWLEREVFTAEQQGDDVLRLALRGTPLEMNLTLGGTTHLPIGLEQAGDAGPRVWTFADPVEVDGRRLPTRWTFEENGQLDSYHVEAYRVIPAAPARLGPPREPPRDVRFDPDVPAELTVSRLPSGHLLVEPLLEDEPLGAFVFDTGAGITVIDRRVADELLMETLGTTVAVGVAGSTTSSYRRGERFQLGPVVIENPIYGDLDLSFMQGGGRRVAGIVGYDLLARCVVEIEPASGRIALHDPARYELRAGAWQDLVLHQNHACVSARFEGEREGLFRLDTGATGTVTFHSPAVRSLGLLSG